MEIKLIEIKKNTGHSHPLLLPVHEKLLGYLVKYFVLGGMPEVVSIYIQKRDIVECRRVMDEKNLQYGVRMSMENFSSYGKIDVNPLYAVDHLISRNSDEYKLLHIKMNNDK